VVVGVGTVKCSGKIKAIFTWVGDNSDDHPPTHAIIKETTTAHWDGETGSCDDDRHHDPIGGTYGQTSTGVTWSVHKGGQTFNIECEPKAEANWDGSGSSGQIGGNASVIYEAKAYWANMTFEGTTVVNTNQDWILIGQKLTATVSVDAQVGSITYSWVRPGLGLPFSDYVATLPLGKRTDWVDSSLASNSWYFAKGTSEDAKCNVTLTSIGVTLLVTRRIDVKEPLLTETNIGPLVTVVGDMKLLSNTSGQWLEDMTSPTDFALYLTPLPGSLSYTGMLWVTKVSPPANFPGADDSQWYFYQLLTTKIKIKKDDDSLLHNYRWATPDKGLDLVPGSTNPW